MQIQPLKVIKKKNIKCVNVIIPVSDEIKAIVEKVAKRDYLSFEDEEKFSGLMVILHEQIK